MCEAAERAGDREQQKRHDDREDAPAEGACVALLSPRSSRHLEVALCALPCGAVSWSTACPHAGQAEVTVGHLLADWPDSRARLADIREADAAYATGEVVRGVDAVRGLRS